MARHRLQAKASRGSEHRGPQQAGVNSLTLAGTGEAMEPSENTPPHFLPYKFETGGAPQQNRFEN